jgi:hypothetical protein
MTIIYRTDGAWGSGKGSNLSPAEVDGNFHDVDTRVTTIEDNPVEPIAPIAINIEGSAFTMGLSNGDTLGPIAITYPMPTWRGNWAPSIAYSEMDFFIAPDGGLGAVMIPHTSAATFDWAAIDTGSGLPIYRKLIGGSGSTLALDGLTDVTLTSVSNGQLLSYDAAAGYWKNATIGSGTGTVTSVATGAGLTGGPVTTTGTIAFASVPTARVLANISGASEAPSANTMTAILDAGFGSTRGSVLYRGSGGWAVLAPGTDGNVLTTHGISADPAWAAAAGGGASISIADTPPGSPTAGALWWDSVGGQLYLWYNDGSSSQWVPSSNQPGPTGAGITQLTGDATAGPGNGSQALTLATVNANVGTFQGLTLDAKGRVTAAVNQSYQTVAAANTAYVAKAGDTMSGALIVNPGNVGIGTTNILGKLHVGGGAAGSAHETFWTYNNQDYRNSMAHAFDAATAANNLITFKVSNATVSGQVTVMTLSGAGGVGVGAVPAAAGLVVGAATGGALGAGKINAVEVRANNVVLTSDLELKTDIEPLEPCLPLVAAIEPKSFRWKPLPDIQGPDGETQPDFTERLNHGFLAQEVASALGGDGETVDLGGMVAVLWQAVRELQDEVAALKGDKPAPRGRH